ncbi:hypothetical protein MPTK1_6g04020 [Marchantia polymorpha subsp. ruderalis]|uniref:PPIase cyclophilin-type domain-containing protein n=2 Tax=Marchantia polymorpha TaxID=3197 RepID=A0A176WUM0_MARPO|nr:hypothetical protein AXG93_93s1210 [Marchantia polymorpha subsp. ruderalis]PTQ41537.1 hypothetical protein MARPO_0034s0116 [Marchantia polymorpha]BBN13503.1 hypothetical protein Mp_6g04020 [Marchantia polymorpha subsp. ruderalis]|eukprot:PTQ41537.1 hypothetical protein MARPO_0034s0116 [Marchantia polymorpha]
MRRKHGDSDTGCRQWVVFWSVLSATCLAVYVFLSPFFYETFTDNLQMVVKLREDKADCCRGMDHLEYWGRAVKWGSEHQVNTSQECCAACKALCTDDGPCQCNSWVFCGDQARCGPKLGQCWLKKQEDPLNPDVQESGEQVMWTSGLIFGKDVGILALETEHGAIRIKLLPDCAPWSVQYFTELLRLRHCAGCQIYRAEARGSAWDAYGKHINKALTGPPYGLLQGTLAVQAVTFKEMPVEACPVIARGMVGWIGGGPDFFISLANHREWSPKFTVFAHVLAEDMEIVENISLLPTTASVWSGVTVAMLNEPVSIKIGRPDSSNIAEVVSG